MCIRDSLKAATPAGKGLGASPGAACGKVVFTADDAAAWNARGLVIEAQLDKGRGAVATVPVSYTHLDVYKRQDMQDMEFTVENRKLYMLQTRNGKRTAQAALKIACDLVDEGMRTEEEAVAMIDPRNLDTLLHPQFDAAALKAAEPMGKGDRKSVV